MISDYKKAKENLLTCNDFLAGQRFFYENGFVLELGYCELLNDNIQQAKELFQSIKEKDIRAKWALNMISMIEGVVYEYPAYFELRNFLEIDLNIFINHYKGDYVQNIIRYSDFMFTINPEVYKFIGRVFYNNGLQEQAMFFLNRAKSYFYNDPELHYLLAFIFYNSGDYQKSLNCANDCLRILPEYFPAIDLINRINTFMIK